MLYTRRFELGFSALVVSAIMIVGCGKDASPRAEPVMKEAKEAPKTTENAAPTPSVAMAAGAENPDAVKPASSAADPVASAAASPAKTSTLATPTPTSVAAPTTSAIAAGPVASEAPPLAVLSVPPEAPPPPPVESPKQSAQAFSVWLQSSGRYSAGQQGTVEAVVVPKNEFHCNPDYPYKFVTSSGSSGVSYPKPTVRGDGLSVSTTRAVMRIPFVPQNAGDTKVGGTFHFSVCSESQCVVEKRDVSVTVKVQ